jgi:hypothetical protein
VDVNQLRRLQLADVGEAELRELIPSGETIAERKAGPPDDGMGPTIAATANSGAAWIRDQLSAPSSAATNPPALLPCFFRSLPPRAGGTTLMAGSGMRLGSEVTGVDLSD